IKNSSIIDKIEFSQDIPSVCASKLLENKVDIALVPVAVIPFLQNPHIISDYCIGAKGKVKTVLLLSDVSLREIKSIYLDYQSRTSVNLIKVLAKNHWKISPRWINAEKGYEQNIKDKQAGVIIGDRTFHIQKKYKYVYDLAEEWEKYTGLPFVFAVWVANKPINNNFIQDFNTALSYGINNIQQVTDEYYSNFPKSKINLHEYFTRYISYEFNEKKKQAMNLFFKELASLNLLPENTREFTI
ncbi:MAG: menaquinone biosynthesis protein, partial [Bacteroidales bacterium]|nr:menaquinone biosynthesis protein [Bacteroidales bacterium]